METTTATVTLPSGETHTRKTALPYTHAVITAAHRPAVLEAAKAHLAACVKAEKVGALEAKHVRAAAKKVAAIEACTHHAIHTVKSMHMEEAAAMRARRLGETVVEVVCS